MKEQDRVPVSSGFSASLDSFYVSSATPQGRGENRRALILNLALLAGLLAMLGIGARASAPEQGTAAPVTQSR